MTSPTRYKRLPGVLIGIGVLAWVPYFYLLITGGSPSIFPYLAVHLAGVLSGAWLRRRARPEKANRAGSRRQTVARILIILGVLAWAPYFYLNEVAMRPQPLGPYLAAHLTGVLGGAALRLSLEVEKIWSRGKANEE